MSAFSFKVSAAVLTLNDNLVLSEVDDKAVDNGFLSKNKAVKLIPGKHTLVVKYSDVFEDMDFAEERLVKSDYFVVKFLVNGQNSLILSTPAIDDLAAAERFSKNPELILLDQNNKEVVLTLEKLSDYKLAKQVTEVVTTLTETNNKTLPHEKVNSNKEQAQAFNKTVINQVDAVPMLKYWWKKATKEEKAHFLNFIKETGNLNKAH